MRILLIWPHSSQSVLSDALSCCEPLSLEYIAGALQPHHEVRIHDLRLDAPLVSLAEDEAPDLVGLAVPFTVAIGPARQVAQQVKQLWPRVPIVLGGHHPTVSSEWLGGFPVDYVVTGEGPIVFKHLVEQMERREPVEPVPGLARFADFTQSQPHPSPTALDTLPFPDRSILHRHRERYFHSIYRPVALVRFTAGCPYNCSFCVLWRLTDRQYLANTIPRIIAELQSIQSSSVYVVDDEAFIQAKRMRQLATEIEQAGIRKRFHMYLRADTVLRIPDVIETWARIGLDSVLIGAESMSDDELREYRKRTTHTQNGAAVELLHSFGVKVRTNFIVNPRYQHDDFKRLDDSVEALGIDLPTFSVLTPLPGTELFEKTRHTLLAHNTDMYDWCHTLLPTAMPLDIFYDNFASLLEHAAARQDHAASDRRPGVFYYSNSTSFSAMLSAIRNAPIRHQAASTKSCGAKEMTYAS
jgi:methyltransferase